MPVIFYSCPSCLPGEKDLVTFLVEGREAPVLGWFAGGKFHSRWAAYDVGRVQSWRPAVDGADSIQELAADWRAAQMLARGSIFARLSNFLRSRDADRDVVPTSRARVIAQDAPDDA